MKFIGRQNELKTLNEEYKRDSSFVVIYGRRRAGKTTLIKEFLKDNNIMLILSGSFISMMQKHTLAYDSPLYGRRTAQIRLAPLSFMEIYNQKEMDFEKAVELYALTGGVPKYLELFKDGRPLKERIIDVVLSKKWFSI